MLIVIYTQTRATQDFEWWHFLPAVKSWLDPFEEEMINAGMLISRVNEVSADGLIFTRTTKFETTEHLNSLLTAIPQLDYQLQRTEYSEAHMHTEVSKQIES